MFVAGSYLVSLTLPVSMTATTSSMVMDVSATLVATTTLRLPGSGAAKTRFCSLVSSDACRGRTWREGSDLSALQVRLISATPGRKMRMPPVIPDCDSSPSIIFAVSKIRS